MEMEERLVVLSGGNVVTKSCVQDLHAKLLKFSKEFQGPKAFVVMTHLVKKAENPSHELLTGELGPLAAITEHDYNQLLGVGDNEQSQSLKIIPSLILGEKLQIYVLKELEFEEAGKFLKIKY
jgi:hypothetical protein